MKIVLATDSFIEGQGGVSTAVAALARSLKQRGHQVMVYTAADPSHKDVDMDIVGLRAFQAKGQVLNEDGKEKAREMMASWRPGRMSPLYLTLPR